MGVQEESDYIKTSTGFGTEGAVLADIFLFKEEIGPDVKIKAAGECTAARISLIF